MIVLYFRRVWATVLSQPRNRQKVKKPSARQKASYACIRPLNIDAHERHEGDAHKAGEEHGDAQPFKAVRYITIL